MILLFYQLKFFWLILETRIRKAPNSERKKRWTSTLLLMLKLLTVRRLYIFKTTIRPSWWPRTALSLLRLETFIRIRSLLAGKSIIRYQFHQRSTYSFYTRGAQKRKKDSQVISLFMLSGSASVKAECKYVVEIEPRYQKAVTMTGPS